MPADDIQYSDRYCDAEYEYRHVILPPDLARIVPRTHLLSETEWRNIGVQQSPGWVHFMLHAPEPHVLIFRRPRPKQDTTQSTLNQSQFSEVSVMENSQTTSTTSTNAVICV